MSGTEVQGYFDNTSTSCPITEYNIVKNTNGDKVTSSESISQFVALDSNTQKLTVSNLVSQAGTHIFYIQALTAGKVAAYKKFTVEFTAYSNEPP